MISKLREKGKRFLILTNTSTSSRTQLRDNLGEVHVDVSVEDIFTACGATASYLTTRYKKARCFLIGEKGFAEETEEAGNSVVQSDLDVVVGVDRGLIYQKLDGAMQYLRGGCDPWGLTKAGFAWIREDQGSPSGRFWRL